MDAVPSARPGLTTPSNHSRSFSFRSDKSGGSRHKEALVESPKEKQRRDLIWKQGSKANPNAALSEAQPGVNAITEESTLTPLRGVQHRDHYGNVITDPDLSNPTRPRLERPLDTIRSFEKAIDNGYKRRSSYNRSEMNDQNTQYAGSRRNSSYHGYENGPGSNRYANNNNNNHNNGGGGGGYYGNQRPDGYGPGPGARSRPGGSRMQSEPVVYNSQPRPYTQGNQFSQDTINTGGSDSTGPWANSTDPSSENSSVERGPSVQRPYVDGAYPSNGSGQNGYNQNGYSQNGYGSNGYGGNGYNGGGGGYGPNGAIPEEGGAFEMRGPAPPVQSPYASGRRPIPLGGPGGSAPFAGSLPPAARPAPEKRKSWLKRTFSRKDSN